MLRLNTDCVIAGGGPAGLMTGYLLARQGVKVIVVEKHSDFLRDFRGDTVHPSTLELFNELGLLDELLERPHQKTHNIHIFISGKKYTVADFNRLKTKCRYIAMMPQWDFLDCLAEKARALPNFKLLQSTRAEDLIFEDGKTVGLKAKTAEDSLEIRASLTIAADGRGSTLRDKSGLELIEHGAPIDVFWLRLPRRPGQDEDSFGRVNEHGLIIQINRGEYWQCAMPLAKGSAEPIRDMGLDAFKTRIAAIAPLLADGAKALNSWDDVKLLTVQVNRLKTWWADGFLCIGDAAHAMSPVGGVGINLAIQDAVAAARMLGPSLIRGDDTTEKLKAVQRRREPAAKLTQRAQIIAQNRIIVPALNVTSPPKPPLMLKLVDKIPALQGIAARAVGIGVKPEHWKE